MDTKGPAEGFKTALEIFEQHAPDILTVDLTIKGKPMKSDLLALLSLGEWHDDVNALSMMADKLPAMLVFYGLALAQAEAEAAALDEECELFIQEKWHPTLEKLTRDVDAMADKDGKKIIGGLKSAPTRDGIRAAIIIGNRSTWDELRARKATADATVKTFSNIFKGVEQRIKLLGNQLYTADGMARRGISN